MKAAAAPRPVVFSSQRLQRAAIFALSLLTALTVWTLLAWWVGKPAFLPSPLETLHGAIELVQSGDLQKDIIVSFSRIIVGFVIGTAIGIPLGLLMGISPFVRTFLDPYVEFFRFIPPIAFVTLAVIWFGLGETSKIVLIVYTTLFMVAINTMIGVLSTGSRQALCRPMPRSEQIPGLFPCHHSSCHPEHRYWHEDRHGQQLYDRSIRRNGRCEVWDRFSDFRLQAVLAHRVDLCRDHHTGDHGIYYGPVAAAVCVNFP